MVEDDHSYGWCEKNKLQRENNIFGITGALVPQSSKLIYSNFTFYIKISQKY